VVAGLVSPSTATSYGSYWKKAEAAWGNRRMATITATEIKTLSEHIRRTALVRRTDSGNGTSAVIPAPHGRRTWTGGMAGAPPGSISAARHRTRTPQITPQIEIRATKMARWTQTCRSRSTISGP
jgi:hypothetical protein